MSKPIRFAPVIALAILAAVIVLAAGSASAQGWRGGGGGGGDRGGGDRGRSFGRGGPGGFGGPSGPGGFGGGDFRGRDGDRRRDGERRDDDKPSSSSSSSTSTSTSSMSPEDYAKGLIKMYDKNGDKMLQKEEQGELSSKNRGADQDGDGVITIDELVRISSSATPTATPAAGGSENKGDRDKGGTSSTKREYTWLGLGTKDSEKRKSFRFSTAADRAASSLPSYFSRDKNGDGQVSMSEYSRSWSKSTVAEFSKYDLNGDGIITAKEAAGSASGG